MMILSTGMRLRAFTSARTSDEVGADADQIGGDEDQQILAATITSAAVIDRARLETRM